MIDEGHIIITDVAELTGIVPIPNLLQGVIESVSGFGIGKSHLKTARIETENQYWRANSYTSNSANKNLLVGSENSPNILPWRKNFKTESGRDSISYTNNESFFDFEEKISTVVDSTGNLVSYDIMGSISANCKVNGMPEIKIILNHPKFIDDCWFHQCVRLKIFESSKVLSFIPPDGKFKLANYSIKHEYIDKLKILPLIVDFSKIDLPKTSFSSSSDNPDPQSSTEQLGYNIKLHPNFNASKTISNVTVTIPISSSAYNIDAKCSAGNYSVDSANSLIKWQIGDISASKKNNIQIRFKFSLKPPGPSAKAIANANANANSISVDYSLLQTSVSGLKIDAIKVFNLKKDMFKGANQARRFFCVAVQFVVLPALVSDQIIVRAHLQDHAALAQNNDLVGVADCRQPVRNDKHRLLPAAQDAVEGCLHRRLAHRVQRARRLVQHVHRWVLDDRARNRKPLQLPAAQARRLAGGRHDRVVPVSELGDELGGMRLHRCISDHFVAGRWVAVADVFLDGRCEEGGRLVDVADLGPEPAAVDAGERDAVADPDIAARRLVEFGEQAGDR
ncbi:AP-3 complex subunit mu-1 [Smittium culicis]|uniref:AP-3 complex subunit mu-1 n=1 Tax=Smittium culicis TaxID=133412 RepID=A0A1R1XCN1_9FUNG|nr:AP-3 complex subunit mu-1 [Smittium culicis]